MVVPDPVYFRDPETGEFGLRCVCGEARADEPLVQCEKCDFWLHSLCVNVARSSKSEQFYCPFCLAKRIRCVCNEPNKYSEPLVQCRKCKMWAHKACEALEFGRIPDNFICHSCDPSDGRKYELHSVRFDDDDRLIPEKRVVIACDKAELLAALPDGLFRTMVAGDLDEAELSFRSTIEKYFKKFAVVLFDRGHEFWRIFVDTLCTVLQANKSVVLLAIDTLATKLLYAPLSSRLFPAVTFDHSESISEFLEATTMPRIERVPASTKLYFHPIDGAVRTPIGLEDGAYVTDLPGFLEHTDEVKCDDGIPRHCLVVTDGDVVVDMEGTSCTFAKHIRRSFHFNCVVKLIRVNGDARVALYATRMKGPLSEEKARRGQAIPEGGELFLPFDGEIPFPVEKCEWREKKRPRQRTPPRPKEPVPEPEVKPKKQQRPRVPPKPAVVAEDSALTLLSGFCFDEIPTLPFILLPDQDAVEKYKNQQMQKARVRNRKGKID
jgi:hypothetical protein